MGYGIGGLLEHWAEMKPQKFGGGPETVVLGASFSEACSRCSNAMGGVFNMYTTSISVYLSLVNLVWNQNGGSTTCVGSNNID
jgi:hypothetical protein